MRTIVMAIVTVASVSVPCARASAAAAPAQVELDRIVGEVNSRIITESDVHQARALHLVDDVSSDEAVRRALEERILVLGEIARSAGLVVADGDVAARRSAWEARVGGHERAVGLLKDTGVSDSALQTWMRDDTRIQAYVKRQFSGVPESERPRATTDWMLRLRQRAGLK